MVFSLIRTQIPSCWSFREDIFLLIHSYSFFFPEGSSEVPNQSGRSDSTAIITARRNLEQQSSEATSSGNNLRAQSASITSNQSSTTMQFNRRPSTISPLNRQQNQPLLLVSWFSRCMKDTMAIVLIFFFFNSFTVARFRR